jgi:hypothetical protein
VSGLTLASTIPLPELRRAPRGAVGCHIRRRSEAVELGSVDWFHRWRLGDRTWLRFGRHAGGYLLRFPDLSDFVVSSAGDRIDCHPTRRLPSSTLRHLLLDQVLPLSLTLGGRVVLHASAVHLPGFGSVAFAGESGRGKSTLAAALASRGGQLVTDDTLVLEREGAEVMAIPGYPGVRLWADQFAGSDRSRARAVAHYTTKRRLRPRAVTFRVRPSPLRALFLLAPRAPGIAPAALARCSPRDRLMGLVRVAYVMDVEDRTRLAELFDNLARVAAEVPVARLRVRESLTTLGRAAEAVQHLACAMPRPCTT